MLQKLGIFVAALLVCSTLYGQEVEVTALGNPEAVVYGLDFSEDGSKLATTEGNLIQVWSVAQRQLLQTLTGHEAPVLTVAYTNDNQLVSGSKDGKLVFWNAATGTPTRQVAAHEGPVNEVAISPDGRLAASAGADHLVKVWNLETGAEEATFSGHTLDVTTVAFSKSSEYLISGGGDRLLKVWHLQDKTLFKTLSGHKDWVRSVSVSPDGDQVASTSDDKRILIWQLPGETSTTPVEDYRKLHSNWITSISYQDDGFYFITTGHDNHLSISRSGSPTDKFYVKYKNPLFNHAGHQYPWKVAFQPNSYRIAIATLGKGVLLTDYFQKVFDIPHSLTITKVNNQRFDAQQSEFSAQRARVKIEGEVSRPNMVSRMTLNHGEESIELNVRKNGKFSVFVDLKENGNDLEFRVFDKDTQINQSVHSIKVNYQ